MDHARAVVSVWSLSESSLKLPSTILILLEVVSSALLKARWRCKNFGVNLLSQLIWLYRLITHEMEPCLIRRSSNPHVKYLNMIKIYSAEPSSNKYGSCMTVVEGLGFMAYNFTVITPMYRKVRILPFSTAIVHGFSMPASRNYLCLNSLRAIQC